MIGDPRKAWSFLTNKKLVEKREKVDWSGINLNHQYYNYLVCGDPYLHYLQYFIQKYIHEPVSVLSLGSGNGNLERVLVSFSLPYSEIHGMDINPDLTHFANQEATRLNYKNVHYSTEDLNQISLPSKIYDLVIFFHSIHHIENLEWILENVKNTLTPGGLLLIVDFVGPSRFQWTDEQIRLTQEMLDLLPPEFKIDLRNSTSKSKVFKEKIYRPTIAEVVRQDPSEAVRSSEVKELLENNFIVLEEKPMGGTLLSLLFDGIAGNFNEKDPAVCSLIKSLQKMEELLIVNKIIPSDFIFMVLKN